MTWKTSRMYDDGTGAWNRSDMLLTKMTRGDDHRRGISSAEGCSVIAKPGPLVRGSPSSWYFGLPIAFKRLARASA